MHQFCPTNLFGCHNSLYLKDTFCCTLCFVSLYSVVRECKECFLARAALLFPLRQRFACRWQFFLAAPSSAVHAFACSGAARPARCSLLLFPFWSASLCGLARFFLLLSCACFGQSFRRKDLPSLLPSEKARVARISWLGPSGVQPRRAAGL